MISAKILELWFVVVALALSFLLIGCGTPGDNDLTVIEAPKKREVIECHYDCRTGERVCSKAKGD